MKKILIVSSSFYPQNSPRSFRTTELAKEFARLGHSVTLLTHKNPLIHPSFENKYGIEIKDLGKKKWPKIKIKGSEPIRLLRRSVSRLLKTLFEYPNLELVGMVKSALKQESGYDILISVAVPFPVHWGVAACRSENHKIAEIWIADCGDPYMGQENDTFKIPFYFGYIEKWFMRKADFITVPTKGAIAAYYPEFHKKIRIIPQGFRFEDYQFESDTKMNLHPTFGYAGMLMPGRRDPSELIDYLKEKDICYEFHIFTQTPQHIKGVNGSLKNKIIVHNPIPRNELLIVLSKMDFLVNFENIGEKQIPSKLIDYAILRKPILSVRTGNLNKEVVDKFLAGNYEGSLIVDDPDQYRIENVCRKFMDLTL